MKPNIEILLLFIAKKSSLEKRCLCSVVVLDFEVCEEDDGGVGGEEDEDVPSTVEVREPHTCPPIRQVLSIFSTNSFVGEFFSEQFDKV